jgi:hypothetical protein
MLRSLDLLKGAYLGAEDGEAGEIEDFLYDDEQWVVRYALLSGGAADGKRVPVSTRAIEPPQEAGGEWRVRLTQDQIRAIPDCDPDQPITREWEQLHFRVFAWPIYWSGGNYWGSSASPGMIAAAPVVANPDPDLGVGLTDDDEEPASSDTNRACFLKSVGTLKGYTVLAGDEEVGEVEDVIADDATWAISHFAVAAGGWLNHKKVLVPAGAFDADSWADGKVNVSLTREEIEASPEWQPLEQIGS